MQLYLENGYLNMRGIIEYAIQCGVAYIHIVGGRGTGKTYGALEMMIEDGINFIYLRRTQTQCETITDQRLSPFKKLNTNKGWNIQPVLIKKGVYAWYAFEDNGEKFVPTGPLLGYATGLTNIANMRGFDASDVLVEVYDEFISEPHERPIKNEASALANAYDTINRNRDLPPPKGEGKPPLIQLCLANANNMANPIFIAHNLVRKADTMLKKKQEVYVNREESCMLIILQESPISEARKQTASYKYNKGTEYASMAFENQFNGNERGTIKSMPLIEYRPVVTVGEITIYTHKSNGTLYVSAHCRGTPPKYGSGEMELTRFARAYSWIWGEYMTNKIIFEEYICEILLKKYFA